MAKRRNITSFLLAAAFLAMPLFSFAQISDQSALIRELQKQIEELNRQVQVLQKQLTETRAELGTEPSPSPSAAPAAAAGESPTPAATTTPASESAPQPTLPSFTRTLSRGVSGEDVRRLQEFLARDKEVYPNGLITGFFGPLTEAALKRWQVKQKIEAVGIVGPKTIAKLNELGRGVVQGLLERGAGASGIIPPGLLSAPGIQKKLATSTPPIATTTPPTTGTTTPSASTATTTPSGTVPAQPISQTGTTTIPAIPAQPAQIGTSTTDTLPPYTPTNFTATSTSYSIWLYWSKSTDNIGVVGYKLYKNGSIIFSAATSTSLSTLSYSDDQTITPGATYNYAVVAYDAAGNISTQAVISVTTPSLPAISPPPPSPAPSPAPPPSSTITHICGTPINVPQDTPSIQTAINSACSGDTIYVAAGRYDENITVTKSRITLKGASGTKPEQVIIDGGGRSDVVYVKGAAADFVIDGFTLQNASQSGGIPSGAGLSISLGTLVGGDFNAGNTIARNLIVMKNSYGIYLWNIRSGSVTIERSVASHNLYNGIDTSSVIMSGQVIMTNNTIANNGRSGYYDWAGGGSRTFRNNIIANNGWYGIYSHKDTAKTISYNDLWNNPKGNYCNADIYGNCIVSSAPSPGTGQLSVDPLFVGPLDYNFNLKSGSRVINAGDPGTFDADGSRADMGAYPYLQADTTAPIISNVQTTSITATSAVITWTTDEASDSQVEWGATTAYGAIATNPSLVASHSIPFSGLASGATYHYRVKSKDAAGNQATSQDQTFSTPAVPSTDTVPPTTTITHPPTDSVYYYGAGTITILAFMSDNVGVTRFQFTLDGANIGSEFVATGTPLTMADHYLSTLSITAGTHSIRGTARDAAGNSSTAAPITITVINQSSPPSSGTSTSATSTSLEAISNLAIILQSIGDALKTLQRLLR